MMFINYKLFMVSIILAEIILCAGYLFVLNFFITSKKMNSIEEKIQKLPEAIIIGEAKCGKLLFLIKIIA
jgi:hypothetical protein